MKMEFWGLAAHVINDRICQGQGNPGDLWHAVAP